MKVLLDEDTPDPLGRHLIGSEVVTVQQMGWAGVQNGQLLDRIAAEGFDVFVTCDQNLESQQNLSTRPFSVIVLVVPNKRMETLLLLIPQILALLSMVQAGQIHHVEPEASEGATA